MRIAIAMVQVPFIRGGAEIHAEMLRDELKKRGHEVDIVTLPFKWYPGESLVNCMMMGRMMDLTEVNGQKIDRVIAMKFPAYYVKHDNKVLWMLHQHRQAYDLWKKFVILLWNVIKNTLRKRNMYIQMRRIHLID